MNDLDQLQIAMEWGQKARKRYGPTAWDEEDIAEEISTLLFEE